MGVFSTSGQMDNIFCSIYKPPSIPDNLFNPDFSQVNIYKLLLVDDLNLDILKLIKTVNVIECMGWFLFKSNVVRKTTCNVKFYNYTFF